MRVRTAFSAAIDRQTLIDLVLQGGQIPATSFAPPGMFGAPEPGTVGMGYDPDLARASLDAFLREKGLADGDALMARYDIVLGHNTGEGHARIAAAIQAMWTEHLGVNVRVEVQDWMDYSGTLNRTTPVEETFHIWRLGWCSDYPDEHSWVYEVFNSESEVGANRLRRNCADPNCGSTTGTTRFDDLTAAAAVEQDPDRRIEMYAEAEDILAREEAAAAFLYHYVSNFVAKPWLDREYPAFGGDNWYEWKIDWVAKTVATGG